eukprot:4754497-Pleurochrysis_carterae.AAC.1
MNGSRSILMQRMVRLAARASMNSGHPKVAQPGACAINATITLALVWACRMASQRILRRLCRMASQRILRRLWVLAIVVERKLHVWRYTDLQATQH